MGKVTDRGWRDQSGLTVSEPYKIVSGPYIKGGSKQPSETKDTRVRFDPPEPGQRDY